MSLRRQVWALLAALLLILAFQVLVQQSTRPEEIAYSKFLDELAADRVEKVEIRQTRVIASLTGGRRVSAERLPAIDEPALLDELRKKGVEFSGHVESPSVLKTLFFSWVLPLGLLMTVYFLVFRRMQRRGGPLSFGTSQAKVYDRSKEERVTFSDVAGVDEAVGEVSEVVDFLTQPDKYRALGARIPKGILLVGPPGTGKTLLARAIAGEAQVPFFSMSGSEFVEMFVGVGAARIRSLFQQANERAPCIVFIDELDAIGKSRGGLGAMATNDEREQTLNQLLIEMDGFSADTGVVLMAATNRPEVLDPALVRAGRFDRQVLVDRPDLTGRTAILEVHARKVHLSDDVDLRLVAQRTTGMVGADLANVVNEAALAAARAGRKRISAADFDESIDRLQLGLQKKSRVLDPAQRRRVAVHESGHAVVALSLEHADPVHRVTIIPRSMGALGVTLQLPAEDKYLVTREELADQLCVMLAGRTAEEVVFESISTGAENDLERATQTARQMVTRFGMSPLGPQTYGAEPALSTLGSLSGGPKLSERSAQRIDEAVDAILAEAAERAAEILSQKSDALHRVADYLLERESATAEALAALLEGPLAHPFPDPTLNRAAS